MSSAVVPGAASSSTTLWATASKEWVIPSKPKPGRKPKKETVQAKDGDTQVDDKGRRVQNRAAQRAFRERKQSQLAELQARLQAYEQGEIERNVALQSIAKRLKEENEALRQENATLKEKLAKYEEQEQQQQQPASTSTLPPENDKKRARAASASTSRKRSKVDPPAEPQVTSPYAPVSSPPELVSSPESADTPDDPRYSSPIAADPPQPCYTTSKPNTYEQPASETLPAFDCGFCSDDTPCVCRIAYQQAAEGLAAEAQKTNAAPQLIAFDDPDKSSSILDNLPTYQPAVPLRRRTTAAPVNSIFAVKPAEPTCSGDPSNCAACASDTFGKAFCEALVESTEPELSPSGRCADCPGDCDRMRGGSSSAPAPAGPAAELAAPQPGTSTIPTHEAWMQLKSHPNVAFEDLAMLADVVSRRAKCTGPRVVISPAPGSITPERATTPVEPPFKQEEDAAAASVWRPPRSPDRPTLVPQHVLKTCGRRGMREVEVTAVQDALRLLDAKFRL